MITEESSPGEGQNSSGVGERVGSVSKRAKDMWKAMRERKVRFKPTGGALLPGDEGYDQGLPLKFMEDGMPVTPGSEYYDQASFIQTSEDERTNN